MSKLVTYVGTVYPWQCDHVGHMNVMWYVGKFDEATWIFFHHIGLTPTYLRQENRGMAAVQQTIHYRNRRRDPRGVATPRNAREGHPLCPHHGEH
jgi:acyl-CoA thioester hydrolase